MPASQWPCKHRTEPEPPRDAAHNVTHQDASLQTVQQISWSEACLWPCPAAREFTVCLAPTLPSKLATHAFDIPQGPCPNSSLSPWTPVCLALSGGKAACSTIATEEFFLYDAPETWTSWAYQSLEGPGSPDGCLHSMAAVLSEPWIDRSPCPSPLVRGLETSLLQVSMWPCAGVVRGEDTTLLPTSHGPNTQNTA